MLISDSELQNLIDSKASVKIHKTAIMKNCFLVTAFVDDGDLFEFELKRSKTHNVEKALQLRGVCKKLKYTVR